MSDDISDKLSTFITKKWIEVHDQSADSDNRYKPRNPITFKTSMLQWYLCDDRDAYVVVKRKITVTDPNVTIYDKKLKMMLHLLPPFITSTLIDNAEDLNIVMPIYNLIEYSKNYSETSKNL